MKKLCDENCNECPITRHPNSRMITKVLNAAFDKFGDDFYKIVQDNCPNLTCCFDCRIDDFCHVEGCELITEPVVQPDAFVIYCPGVIDMYVVPAEVGIVNHAVNMMPHRERIYKGTGIDWEEYRNA